jgi:single-stranded-DNA-specific exonuclease
MSVFAQRPFSDRTANWLAQSGLHPLLARLYAARGVDKPDELSLDLKQLLSPVELKNCISTASLLADILEKKESMLIVADYDCDGATACAVGLRGLRMLGGPETMIQFLVPNRFTMGYGLTPEVVELAAQQTPKPKYLITVDNGIASEAGVDRARELGMEVIVTDHHLPGDRLPKATAIVNPNQPGCSFPSKALAGVGVMFYLLVALRAELRQRGKFTAETQPKIENLLDLVALGTVADVAQLDRNNRILVSNGLKRIRAGASQAGIQALFQAAVRDPRKTNTFDLGFARSALA